MDSLNNGERQVAPSVEGIRRDHVARYEFAASLLHAGDKVLDVACGVGYGTHILAKHGCVVMGCDRSPEALDYAQEHYAHDLIIRWARIDAENPPEFGKCNAAVCFETIEHLRDPLPLLKALNRAAPWLAASVPNEAVFPHNGRVLHHVRHYTRAEFKALLEAAGYRVLGWYGQHGKESEVEPDIEGRTLIAIAMRNESPDARLPEPQEKPEPVAVSPACPLIAAQADKPPKAEKVPEHVAIVGLGPSRQMFFELVTRLGGASAWCDEIWGINALGDVLRCDRVFHMDDVRIQELRAAAQPDSNIAEMVRWLKTHPGPIYTSVVREGYPGLVAFPLEDVLNARYDVSNGGAPYFNSTAAYAVAFAVHLGVKKISCWGLDYTLPNSHQAEKGRACVEFWLGIAAARGIEINVPDCTSLMDACEPPEHRLYGYDCVEVALHDESDGRVRVRFKDRDKIPTAEEIEARYDHRKHPNPLMAKEQ